MSDTTEGSSGAAQSAQVSSDDASAEAESRGLFGRILDAFSPPEEPSKPDLNGRAIAPALPALGMINLRRMRVEDVAIPQADIKAVPLTIKRDELVDTFRESGKTRLPVFDGTLDTPVGFVNLKDFALRYGFNGKEEIDLRALLRPLLYVPPSMPLHVLLQKMQTERIHMALVIDEYGGTDGLVTIEDLLEQVVGDIDDEHDAEEAQLWSSEAPGVYLARAKVPVQEFEAEIGRSLSEGEDIDPEEIDTLGGLVFMLAGRVPARGEIVPHPAGPEFEVVDADPRRIKRLRVRLTGTQGG